MQQQLRFLFLFTVSEVFCVQMYVVLQWIQWRSTAEKGLRRWAWPSNQTGTCKLWMGGAVKLLKLNLNSVECHFWILVTSELCSHWHKKLAQLITSALFYRPLFYFRLHLRHFCFDIHVLTGNPTSGECVVETGLLWPWMIKMCRLYISISESNLPRNWRSLYMFPQNLRYYF